MASSSSKRYPARARASSWEPHPRGSQEDEAADRAIRVCEPGSRLADGLRDGDDGGVLADHAPVQRGLHRQEAFGLVLEHPADRDAGAGAHDPRYLLPADHGALHPALLQPAAAGLCVLCLQDVGLVAQGSGALVVAFLYSRGALAGKLLQAKFLLAEVVGHHRRLYAQLARRLV